MKYAKLTIPDGAVAGYYLQSDTNGNASWAAVVGGGGGSQGYQGNQGYQGVVGNQGATGVGTQGNQGNQGYQGVVGNQGSTGVGTQGNQGNQGNQGLAGNQGTTGVGTQGNQGNQGTTGVGTQGNQGYQGVLGNQGTTGVGTQGNQGNQGYQGVLGNQGATGVGSQGNQGNQGYQGVVGNQGVIGNQGNTGVGTQGNQGNQGYQGVIGTQGNQGTTGVGTQGNQGTTGVGTQGNQGTQGYQGVVGNQGVIGNQGSTGVGTQGNQGSTGVGTQGNQGSTGVGTQGNQGSTGVGTQGNQGSTGVGTQGNQGSTGVGTQGNQGNQGNQGVVGNQGTTGVGTQGNQGNQGVVGNQGSTGVGTQGNQGNQGFQGVVGNQGSTGVGTQGNQGNQGFQGVVGNQGSTGVGTQGNQGFQGVVGNQGSTGVGTQGNQGNQGVVGNQGSTGVGTQGNQGYQGVVGNQGSTGVGTQGNQGDVGNQGSTGVGTQGNQGNQGYQGVIGNQGTTGVGTQGNQGYQGYQGVIGNQGVVGNQGTTGVGTQGNQGNQGFQGVVGNQGTTGVGTQGNQGNQGFQGVVGNQGTAGTGSVVSVAMTVPTGLSVSGSPITTSGTFAVTTALSGMVKGTGSGFAVATAGTDYLTPTGVGTGLTALNASNLGSGTVPTARLGTGTANTTTYLRGDRTWATIVPAAGGAITEVQYNSAGLLEGEANFTYDDVNQTVTIGSVGANAGTARLVILCPSTQIGQTVDVSGMIFVQQTANGGTSPNFAISAYNLGVTSGDCTAIYGFAAGGSGSNISANAGVFGEINIASSGPITGAGVYGKAQASWNNPFCYGGYFEQGAGTNIFALLAKGRSIFQPVFAATEVPMVVRGFASQSAALQQWQNSANTVLSSITSAGVFTGSGAGLTTLNATNLSSGTVATARLGSGTANSSSYLRGDQTWAAVPSAGADALGTYIVRVATNAPSNAQILASLTTGIMKNTTTTGVVSIATAGTDYLTPTGSGAGLTALNATQLTSGNVPLAALGTGTPAAGKYVDGASGVWTSLSGGGTPGGSTTQVQYNNAGAFGGDSAFVFNNTTKTITMTALNPNTALAVSAGASGIAMTVVSTGATGMTINTPNSPALITTSTGNLAGSFSQTGTLTANSAIDTVFIYKNPTLGAFSSTGAVLHVEDNSAATGDLLTVIKNSTTHFVVNQYGCLGLGLSNPSTGFYMVGGRFVLDMISAPQPTSVAQIGVAGSTTYYYWLISQDRAFNPSSPGLSRVTTTSNATLSVSNFNRVTWAASPGAIRYFLLRTTSATVPAAGVSASQLVATVVSDGSGTYTADDKSNTVTGYLVPARNVSGDMLVGGQVRLTLGAGAGLVLTSDLNGYASWQTPSTAAGGSATYVQFNTAGALDGDASFTWDNTTKRLSVATSSTGISSTTVGGIGVIGTSTANGFGVKGNTLSGVGVYGTATTNIGVAGESNSGNAGQFYQTGTLTANAFDPVMQVVKNSTLSGFTSTGAVLAIADNATSTGHLFIATKGASTYLTLDTTGVLTASGNIHRTRNATGATAGDYWGLRIFTASNTDTIVFGHTSSAYTTGGIYAWAGNSHSFLYYPTDFYIGSGGGVTPTIVMDTSRNVTINGPLQVNSTISLTSNLQMTTTGNGAFAMNTGAGTYQRQIVFQRNGIARWVILGGAAEAETGGNVGTNFYVQSFDDSGNFLNNNIYINRASGGVACSNDLVVAGTIYQYGGNPMPFLMCASIAFKVVANTTTTTNVLVGASPWGTDTFAANTFQVGDTFRVTCRGYYSTAAVVGGINFYITFGGTVLLSGSATLPASVVNKGFRIEAQFTIYSTGASANVVGQGMANFAGVASTTVQWVDMISGGTTFNSTINNQCLVQWQWGTASASNTVTGTTGTIERLN